MGILDNQWRFNPFTAQLNFASKTEYHTIEFLDSFNLYGIQTDEGILKQTSNYITVKEVTNGSITAPTYGTTFSENDKSIAPSTSEYRVDYDSIDADLNSLDFYNTAVVEFNAADSGTFVEITYFGTGRIVSPRFTNQVGLGSIIFHTIHLSNSSTLAEMRLKGFALCDGTNAESQVQNPDITGALPNLIQTAGNEYFLKPGSGSGTFEDDAIQSDILDLDLLNPTIKTLKVTSYAPTGGSRKLSWIENIEVTDWLHTGGGAGYNVAYNEEYVVPATSTDKIIQFSHSGMYDSGGLIRTGTRTKPRNMTALPLMCVKL